MTTGSSQTSPGNSWKSTSGTGMKWGVPQVQGGSGKYLRFREDVGNNSGTGRNGEDLRYREEVGSTSDTGRKWGVPQGQG